MLVHYLDAYISKRSSFLSEEAFVRAALSDCDCQEVHGDVRHRHSVHVGETGDPGRGWTSRHGLGPRGAESGLRRTLLRSVSPVFLRALRPPVLRNTRHVAAPARPLVTPPRVWAECAAQSRTAHESLFAAGFGGYRGLLLKPLGQLDEAVIRRLSVMVQASGHFGQTVRRRLLQQSAPFDVRLC